EVAAGWIGTRRREFGAVRFEKRLITGPILSPPNTQRSFEDRSRVERIGNDWSVELRPTRFGGRDWPAGDHPLRRVAVLEVYIVEVSAERVKPQRGIGNVEARLTAIAVDLLV